MKHLNQIVVALVILTSLTACNDKRTRKVQYMPDMYVAVPYEANSVNPVFADGMTDRQPVAGTIARGALTPAYQFEDTNAGYELAKSTLESPLKTSEENLENGKKMYTIYCAVCHGKKGDGQGVLVKREKFLGVPNYKDRTLTDGSIYHVIMFGKGAMGSHASQLSDKERWQVVQYVQQLKNK